MSAPATPVPARAPLSPASAAPDAAGDAPRSPYVGPRSFQTGETLHGRAPETNSLVDLLLAERVVLLHSPSGAGKTSLLNAEIVPRLRDEGLEVLPPARVGALPTPPPPGAWNRYVLSVLSHIEKARPEGSQRGAAELAGLTLGEYLATGPRAGANAPEVLILDQFEELLTSDPQDVAAKEEFCRQLGDALKARNRWAIVAMREEAMGALAPYLRHIPTALAHRFRLGLLSPAAARDAIRLPAAAAGRPFREDALDQLVRDLSGAAGDAPGDGTFIEPVHLQVVCTQVWHRLPADAREIRPSDVTDVGGVDDALMSYYAAAVAHAAAAGSTGEGDLRDWIQHTLVTGGRRAQALLGTESAAGVTARAVEALQDRYVVRREERRGGIWIELAHDRLVGPALKDNARWCDAHLTPLERRADRWLKAGRPDDLLLSPFDRAAPPTWLTLVRTGKVGAMARGGSRSATLLSEYGAASVRHFRVHLVGLGALIIIVVFSVVLTVRTKRANAALAAAKQEAEALADSLQHMNLRLQGTVESQQTVIDVVHPEGHRDTSARAGPPRPATARPVNPRPGVIVAGAPPRPGGAAGAPSATPSPSPAAVRLQYFKKPTDPPALEQGLRALGYPVVTRPALYSDLVTNFIAFGSRVPVSDVRRVALAATERGVVLKAICRFSTDAGARGDRSTVVQVLGADLFDRAPPITRARIEQMAEGRELPCP